MSILIGLLGLVFVLFGFYSLLFSDTVKQSVWIKILQMDWFLLSGLTVVIGAIVFAASFSGNLKVFMQIIAVLSIIKGIVIVPLRENKEKIADWYMNLNSTLVKVTGVAELILGVLFIFSRLK